MSRFPPPSGYGGGDGEARRGEDGDMSAKGLRTGLLVGGIVCGVAGVASIVGSALVTTSSFSTELSDF